MYYVIVAICALIMIFIMIEIGFYNQFQLLKIKNKKLSRFDLNHELTIALREYHSLLDLDKKLSEIEALKNINEDLIDIDNDLNAAKKYYNDNIVLYYLLLWLEFFF